MTCGKGATDSHLASDNHKTAAESWWVHYSAREARQDGLTPPEEPAKEGLWIMKVNDRDACLCCAETYISHDWHVNTKKRKRNRQHLEEALELQQLDSAVDTPKAREYWCHVDESGKMWLQRLLDLGFPDTNEIMAIGKRVVTAVKRERIAEQVAAARRAQEEAEMARAAQAARDKETDYDKARRQFMGAHQSTAEASDSGMRSSAKAEPSPRGEASAKKPKYEPSAQADPAMAGAASAAGSSSGGVFEFSSSTRWGQQWAEIWGDEEPPVITPAADADEN